MIEGMVDGLVTPGSDGVRGDGVDDVRGDGAGGIIGPNMVTSSVARCAEGVEDGASRPKG